MYNGWFKITSYQIHTDYRIIVNYIPTYYKYRSLDTWQICNMSSMSCMKNKIIRSCNVRHSIDMFGWPNILALEIPIRDWSAAQDDVTLDF